MKSICTLVSFFLLASILCFEASAEEKFVKYSEIHQKEMKPTGAILPAELSSRLKAGEEIVILDARSKAEFDQKHLAGASLPAQAEYYKKLEMYRQKILREAPKLESSLSGKLRSLRKDAPIVTYCNRKCGLSKQLKMELGWMGFANVQYLEGGINDWEDQGYPVEVSRSES